MAKKPTKKEELYCQHLHKHGNKSAAYRHAYSTKNMKDATINNKAYALSKKGEVRARLQELEEEAQERNKVTVDSLLLELEENRQAALTAETAQSSAATAATMGKAKLLGLDKAKADESETGESIGITFAVSHAVGEVKITKGEDK